MRKLSGVFLVAALALAACGGGSSNKTSNASANSDTVTTAKANSSGDLGDFCGARAGFNVSTPNPSADLKTQLQQAKAALAKGVQYSPAEIRADVRTIADGFNVYYDAMAKANFNFQALASNPDAMAALQKFNDPAYKAAADHINTWIQAHCK